MSGNLWMFSDKLDDEDIEIMKHEFITYYQGAVHQIVPAVHFQQRTAAGDFMGRADELNFHVCTSRIHV